MKKYLKDSKEDIWFNSVNYSLITLFMIIVLYPLYFIIIASFSEPLNVFSGDVWLWPVGFTLKGYKAIFDYKMIWIGYRNTILYTVVGTSINLFLTIPAAYSLSRKDLYGRTVIMGYFVFTMFFSGGLIPTFLVVRSLGLYNTFWVMVVLGGVATWNLIICRTYFSTTIPHELWEAASIDGCRDIKFFISVVLPLSKVIIAVMALFYAVGHWNEYMRALIYLKDRERFTLQLVLRDILILDSMEEEMDQIREGPYDRMEDLIRYGSIVVASVPMLIAYPFLQKYFLKGVMIGSLKG